MSSRKRATAEAAGDTATATQVVDNDEFTQGNGHEAPTVAPGPVLVTSASSPAAGFIHIPVDELDIDTSRNLRRFETDNAELKELSESIAQLGQLQPIGVLERPEGGLWPVLFGFRRSMALRYAQQTTGAAHTVLARVIPQSEVDAMLMNLAENRERKELSWMDMAHAIGQMAESGKQISEIAQHFRKSRGWVGQVKAFLNLPLKYQKALHEGKMNFAVARSMNGLEEAECDKQFERFQSGMAQVELISKQQEAKDAGPKEKRRKKKANKEGQVLTGRAAMRVLEEYAVLPKKTEEGETYKPGRVEVVRAKLCGVLVKLLGGKLSPAAAIKAIEREVA